jgi:hypothetical protein
MAYSGRQRHRDREPGLRQLAEPDVPASNRVFRLTGTEREKIAQSLRYIDEARRALEGQHNADNRKIVRDLRAAADRIYELINDLAELEG